MPRVNSRIHVVTLTALLMAAPAQAQFEIHGSVREAGRFARMVTECSTRSPLFAELVHDIEREAVARNFSLIIEFGDWANPAGHFSHRINTYNRSTHIFKEDYTARLGLLQRNGYVLDLEDLHAFPMAVRDPTTGTFRLPSHVPSWAPTRCQALGHELKEQFHAHTSSAGFHYPSNHAEALAFENSMRVELGQDVRSDDRPGSVPGTREFNVGMNVVVITADSNRVRLSYR